MGKQTHRFPEEHFKLDLRGERTRTEKMAESNIEGISSEGIEAKLFRIPVSDRGDIIKELLAAKGVLVGSSTINNGILPTVAPFLEEMAGLRPRNKLAGTFGSYGWGGEQPR